LAQDQIILVGIRPAESSPAAQPFILPDNEDRSYLGIEDT